MNAPSASDSTYHARHARRSLRRAERIAENIDDGSSVLDVGCNNGITSRYLLDLGKAYHATGIELHAETVDAKLRADERFTFIEGDIAKLGLPARYDVCVYGAVHHHILNFHGLSTAVATFQKLAEHCNQRIFFETGQLGEGGRWDWQRAIRRYFHTDEEHICYLLKSIEHQIIDFSTIGRFWIHGIRRSYLRIDLKPAKFRQAILVPAPVVDLDESADGPMFRSFGSRRQQLTRDGESVDSPTAFWISSALDGTQKFIKQYRHHPAAAEIEWAIGMSATGDWPVKPEATTILSGSLVFPYLADARRFSDLASAPKAERRAVADQLLRIFSDAGRIHPVLPARPIMRARNTAALSQLCDLNPNNVLIDGDGNSVRVRIVDFEQQGTRYLYRNRMHLASMLVSLRCHRGTALLNWLIGAMTGVWWLFEAQLMPFDARVKARQPSLFSVVVAAVRSRTGQLLRAVLAAIGHT